MTPTDITTELAVEPCCATARAGNAAREQTYAVLAIAFWYAIGLTATAYFVMHGHNRWAVASFVSAFRFSLTGEDTKRESQPDTHERAGSHG